MGGMPERSGFAGGVVDSFLSRPIAGDAVLAILLAVPLGAMSFGLLTASISPRWHVLAAGSALVVLHVGVVWRRRFPQVVFLLGAVAMLALVLMPALQDPTAWRYPPVLLPSSLTFGLLLYTAGSQLRRRRAVAALVVALGGVVAVVVRLWSPATWGAGEAEPLVWRIGLALGLTAMSGCLWALGRLSGIRGKYLAQVREKAERAEQDRARERSEAARAERNRISREMHDVVSHSLAVMVSQAEGGRLMDTQAASAPVFGTIAQVGRDALQDMRALLGVLRAEEGSGSAGSAQPQPGLADLPQLLTQVRAAGLEVDLTEHGTAGKLRPAADLAAYRLIQEALTNVIKHAGATGATVRIEWQQQQVLLCVSDDGVGASAEAFGTGLTGMRERTRLVGGTLETGNRAGAGFQVRATLPQEGRSGRSSR